MARIATDRVELGVVLCSGPNPWNPGMFALFVALLCAAPRTSGAAPQAPSRVVALVPASRVVIPPTDALVTAWPLAPPCADPRWFDVAGERQGTLFWSSISGSRQLSFGQALTNETLVLPSSLTSGALERLWVSSGPNPVAIYLNCKEGSDQYAEPSIEWNVISNEKRAEVTARYGVAAIPKPKRLERWINPPTRNSASPERDNLAPFSVQLGREWRRIHNVSKPSIRLTLDMLADLREVIAVGCAGRRCTNVFPSLVSATLEVMRDPRVRYEQLDQDTLQVEPFGHYYEWRITGDTAQAKVGCYSTWSDQVLCELTLTTSAHEILHYDAWNSKIELTEPSGLIEFAALEGGGARVTISGAALALRGGSNASNKK